MLRFSEGGRYSRNLCDRAQRSMPSADEILCQPDVLTTSKFRALDRYAGGKCSSQLRVVHLAPYESVIVGRQACPHTVLLRKISQQLLQFGNRKGDRNATILRWDSNDTVHDQRVLAVLPKRNRVQPALHAPQTASFHEVLEKSFRRSTLFSAAAWRDCNRSISALAFRASNSWDLM